MAIIIKPGEESMCSTASTDFIIWILLLQTQTQTGLGKKNILPQPDWWVKWVSVL